MMFGVAGEDWIDVMAGTNFAFAKHENSAWGWGQNTVGQLGNNSITNASSPISVSFSLIEFDLSAGSQHSALRRKIDGRLFAWGNNDFGQLGDNSLSAKSIPVSIFSATSWKQAICGNQYTMAIRGVDGRLFSWGYNYVGQLGNNSTNNRSIPASVFSSDSWKQIACGTSHALAIRGSDGRLFAWGNNNSGQLGDNSIINKSIPVSVFSGDSWKQVACGYVHTLAIRGSDGRLFGWGSNTYGECGNNSTTNKSIPTSVFSTDSWIQVACGYYYSLAIRGSDGRLFGWGINNAGQLGNNSTINKSIPTSVNLTNKFIKISAGWDSTYGLDNNYAVWSWGNNAVGQLGLNTLPLNSYSIPVQVIDEGNSFRNVVGASAHTLAIRESDGRLFAWGLNNTGQLGDNSLTSKFIPISVSSNDSWTQVACDYVQTLAIRGSDGKLFAWGDNFWGQLGDNSTTSRLIPTSVSFADSCIKIACGISHSLAIRESDGRLFAWGLNDNGQLGDNTNIDKSVPTSVFSADSWKQVDSGENYSLAIRGSDGRLFGWGFNDGQLGDNTRVSKSIPTSVFSADSWRRVACGYYHALAIRGSDGRLFGWGYNNYGQLGDNSTLDRRIPTSVSSTDSWAQVACGRDHSAAIRGSDGRLFAWGYNNSGQLGDNSRIDKSIPTFVFSADSWTQVECGYYYTLAIRGSDGKVFAWGDNSFGQLGVVRFALKTPTLICKFSG